MNIANHGEKMEVASPVLQYQLVINFHFLNFHFPR
jgi:hypothetical protein